MLREKFKWRIHENESTDAKHSDGLLCNSDEVSAMEMEQRGWIIPLYLKINQILGRNLWKSQCAYQRLNDGSPVR